MGTLRPASELNGLGVSGLHANFWHLKRLKLGTALARPADPERSSAGNFADRSAPATHSTRSVLDASPGPFESLAAAWTHLLAPRASAAALKPSGYREQAPATPAQVPAQIPAQIPALSGGEQSRVCSAAERQRLAALFEQHHALVWRAVRRLGATPEQAADTTQQAFLVALERLPEIRFGCERAFLLATALTLARTRHRREQRCVLEGDMDSVPSAGREVDAALRQRYAQQLIDQVLTRLDPELVTVFVLFELEGITVPELAEVLDIPQGTVSSRLRRAREGFRAEASRLEVNRYGGQP
jgi:RNA polymerase sigma-70 factor, ECF subfamily